MSDQVDKTAPLSADARKETPSSTIRLSRRFRKEVQGMAAVEGLSMNAFVVRALDVYMQSRGRKPLAELDPQFVDYLQRKREAV